tara:strand:+ start:169 stop:1344 length:1176 start_codon:yes stop_codon:yes gene_type:complete
MKKLIAFSILTYLLFIINIGFADQKSDENNPKDQKILKIGVLLPLSGEFKNVGQSFLKAIQLALVDIGDKNVKIFLKDTKSNPLDSYLSAKEFEELGIEMVIGPIFFENLERLGEINNIKFISLTNKSRGLPKNVISFGININSQIEVLKKYFDKIKITKTILMSPKGEYENQVNTMNNNKINFYRTYYYDISAKKITGEIEKITNYRERKKDLERRIKILKKSDLYKDKKEIEILEQRHTLGKVNFDSVVVFDFEERLKSVLTSFMFSDVTSKEVDFFTLNQWFDESLFNEDALQNLHFPSINLKNLKRFEKKYFDEFKNKPNKVSILAYDALGLIYYCWKQNNGKFEINHLYNKDGYKGLHGKFIIKGNTSEHQLEIYKVDKKKFLKVY